jgi:hypothetical protein
VGSSGRKRSTVKSNPTVASVRASFRAARLICSDADAKLFRVRAVWFYVLLSLVIFVLLFLRRPGALLFPTVYFEDGNVFYRDQLLSASAATVFKPFYMGYYILVPRLVSFLAWLMPARLTPYCFNLSGLAIGAAATSFFCLSRFRCIIASDVLRVALCVLFAITLDSTEALATPSNCFWLLGIPVILLAAIPPTLPVDTKWWRQVAWLLGGTLLGLTTPLVVIAAPVALWQTYANRKKNRWPLPAGLVLAALCQIAIYFEIAVRPKADGRTLNAMITALLVATAHRVVMSSMLGWKMAFRLMSARLTWVPLLSLAFLEGIGQFLFSQKDKFVRLKSLLCMYVLGSGVILALAGKGYVSQFQQIDRDVLYGGQRYFFLSSCAFAVLSAMAIERSLGILGYHFSAQWPKWKTETAMVLGLTFIFGGATYNNFRLEDGTDPHWITYAPLIDSWKRAVILDAPAVQINVPVNATGWSIYLPGSRLSNGDVESGDINPWAVFGSARAEVSAQQHHSGMYSILLDGAGGIFTDLLCPKRGKRYHVTAWTKSDCSGPKKSAIWVHDGAKYQVSAVIDVSCGEWRRVSAEFVSTDTRMMRVHLMNNSGAGTLYWDDIAISTF